MGKNPMTPRIPPTTAIDLSRTDRSPCCDADLVLSSPPDGYECRECMTGYDLSDDSDSDPPEEPRTIADDIEAGVCPWCDGYDGEYVGQHASSAHPDQWDAYKGE